MSNDLTILITLACLWPAMGTIIYATQHGRTRSAIDKLNADFLNIPPYEPSEYSDTAK